MDARQPAEPHPDDGRPHAGPTANGNFAPDCDLLNPRGAEPAATRAATTAAPGTTTRSAPRSFSTTYDPDMFKGWYTRPMDWELGASVQRQIAPRMSVEVGYGIAAGSTSGR